MSLGTSLAEGFIYIYIFFYWLTCGRRSLVSGTQNDIVVSWITLWWMIKVYWFDLTLAYIFDHAVCCASAASSGRSLHLRTKQSSSKCPNHVRRTKTSIKKRIVVRRTVRSMFGEQTFSQLMNRPYRWAKPAHPTLSVSVRFYWLVWFCRRLNQHATTVRFKSEAVSCRGNLSPWGVMQAVLLLPPQDNAPRWL